MPAAAKIEKPASGEMTNGKAKNASNANNGTNHVVTSASMLQDPQKIVNTIIEKKIRNLEKRKTRLLEIKALEDKGQQLEAEQKIAVKKLENVVEMVDMLKEIGKSVTDGLTEHAKLFKKQQKKEQIEKQTERQQQDLERVKFWLNSQLIVSKYLPLDSVKTDLQQGKLGEIKIEENQVEAVNKLGDLLAPSNFELVESSVEKLNNLLEGNKREFSTGLSYSDVKDLLNQLKESKYFENISLTVEPIVSSSESTENDKSLSEENKLNEPVQTVSEVKPEEPAEPKQAVQQNVHHLNNQLCFMRDTRVETELQHKDPAVVAVASLGFPYPPQNGQALSTSSGSSANPNYPPPHIYPTVPIQTQTFQNASYPIPANFPVIPVIPTTVTHQISIPEQAISRNVAPDAPTIPIDSSEVSPTKVNGQFSPDIPKEASQDGESKPVANGQFDNRGSFQRGRPRGRGGFSRGGNFSNYHNRGGRGGGGGVNPSENKGNFGGYYNNNNNGNSQNFNSNSRPVNRQNGGGSRPYRQDRGVRNQNNQFNNDQAAPVPAK